MSEDMKTAVGGAGQELAGGVAALAQEGRALPAVPWVDRYWKMGVLSVLYGLLFREELLRLFDRWSTPQESHGWLIPAFSLYFLHQDRGRLSQVTGKSSYVGLLFILLSVFGYLYSVFTGFFYPRQLMMLTMLGGVVLFLGGWQVLRIVWLPIAYLIFAMPLPSRLYYEIIKRGSCGGGGGGDSRFIPGCAF